MSSRASYCRLVILVAATSLLAGAGFAVMLWGGTLFGEGPCEVYSDSSPQRAFCALARQHKPAHLAAYVRGRSTCEWKHLPALATKWRADIDSKNLYVLQKSSLKKPLQVCHFDAPGHGKWTLYRLGPFDTTGGYDWNEWGPDEMPEGPGAGAWIDGDGSFVVDGAGTIMDWPLHAHHIHMTEAKYNFATSDHKVGFMMGTHTDGACAASLGGVACQVRGERRAAPLAIPPL